MFHVFFEQSANFKEVLEEFNIKSITYDIKNNFNKTDVIIDLFKEIEKEYKQEKSIFENINKNETIIAFFPCERFTHRMKINFTRMGTNNKKFSQIEKLEQNIKYFEEINRYYSIINKLVIICIKKQIKLIIENPYQKDHVLNQFWNIKPKIIDMDRTKNGDNFKKPTQYFFINCEPKNNIIIENIEKKEKKTINETHNKIERSLISKDYVRFFIKKYIL